MTTTLKTRRSAKLLALALSLIGAGAFANTGASYDTARLGDLDFGIICPAGDVKRVPAEGTALGYISERHGQQRIEHTTNTIPMVKGMGFGVQSTNISGRTLGPVLITVTHPKFPNHNSSQDVWSDTFALDSTNFNFFTFEFPFEMQTGVWTFSAMLFDQPLFFVKFNVVKASDVPHLAAACAGPALTS